MARTKSFKALVRRHVKHDKKFAEALLREGVDATLSGDVDTGKTILRDYIKAMAGSSYVAGQEELAAIDEALEQAKRGQFATDAEVEAAFARFRK